LYLCRAAAEWFSEYLEDYLDNITTPVQQGNDIKRIFESFDNFKDEITKIYSNSDQYQKAVASIQ